MTAIRSKPRWLARVIGQVALSVCVLVFTASSLSKLVPAREPVAVGPVALLAPGSFSSVAVALLEAFIAVGLLIPRSRRFASGAASLLLLAGVCLLAILMLNGQDDCGCFGGWFRLTAWVHVGMAGVLLAALVPLAAPPLDRSHSTSASGKA